MRYNGKKVVDMTAEEYMYMLENMVHELSQIYDFLKGKEGLEEFFEANLKVMYYMTEQKIQARQAWYREEYEIGKAHLEAMALLKEQEELKYD